MGQNIVGLGMEQSELSVESTLPKIPAFSLLLQLLLGVVL
jgi:hypothetical protein